MEIVIIRSPVVYGPNVKVFSSWEPNFAWYSSPLLLIKNKRSLVSLRNLVDFIVMCAEHPKAADQTFFVSDGQDLSTPELLRAMAHAMGKRVLLFPFPPVVLMFFLKKIGKKEVADRLLGSLEIDISKNKSLLGWSPPYSIEEEFKLCFLKK